MPRELFSVRPPVVSSRAGRGWVPLSLIAHGVALAAVVVTPLVADGEFPPPHSYAPPVLIPAVPPPPPEHVPPRRADRAVVRHSSIPEPGRSTPAPSDAPRGLPPVDNPPVEQGFGQFDPAAGGGGLVGAEPLEEVPAPPPARHDAPRRISGGITAPVKITDVPPAYPAIARQAHVEGMVILEAVIGIDGRVTNVRVLRSVPLLDRAAVDAVKQWTFRPATLNREPVAVVMTVTVNFQLD